MTAKAYVWISADHPDFFELCKRLAPIKKKETEMQGDPRVDAIMIPLRDKIKDGSQNYNPIYSAVWELVREIDSARGELSFYSEEGFYEPTFDDAVKITVNKDKGEVARRGLKRIHEFFKAKMGGE